MRGMPTSSGSSSTGAAGLLPGNSNMPALDKAGWADRWNQVEQAAGSRTITVCFRTGRTAPS